jgi:DNA repair exonuclease SbcCD ATPase subunit
MQSKLEAVEEDLLQRNREISRLQADVDRMIVQLNQAASTTHRLESSLEESQQANAVLTEEKAEALREGQRTEMDRKLQLQQASEKHARAVKSLQEEAAAKVKGLQEEHVTEVASLNSRIDDITAHAQVHILWYTQVMRACVCSFLVVFHACRSCMLQATMEETGHEGRRHLCAGSRGCEGQFGTAVAG